MKIKNKLRFNLASNHRFQLKQSVPAPFAFFLPGDAQTESASDDEVVVLAGCPRTVGVPWPQSSPSAWKASASGFC